MTPGKSVDPPAVTGPSTGSGAGNDGAVSGSPQTLSSSSIPAIRLDQIDILPMMSRSSRATHNSPYLHYRWTTPTSSLILEPPIAPSWFLISSVTLSEPKIYVPIMSFTVKAVNGYLEKVPEVVVERMPDGSKVAIPNIQLGSLSLQVQVLYSS